VKHRLLPASETQKKQSDHRTSVIGIVVACDDERFIGSLVLSIRSHIDELIVIDDGSLDNTATIARSAGATVLQHASHMGRIAAVNTGLRHVQESGPAIVLVLDAASEYRADDLADVLAPLEEEQADIVLGIRSDHAQVQATTTLTSSDTSDLRTATYGLAPHLVNRLTFDEHGTSFERQLVQNATRDGLRVITLALAKPPQKKRPQPARRDWQVFSSIFRLIGEDRPLLFFGLSGVLLFILGGVLGVYITQIYAETGTLAIGYGLLTVLLCVIGTVLFFAGIILHSTRAMMTELRRSLQLQGIGKEQPSLQVVMPGDEILLSDASDEAQHR
jgi:hypothetical protein